MMAQQFKYPRCQKGGEHNGQLLNLVCLERSCSHQSIICDVCYAQAHEGHKIKPLKVLLQSARKHFQAKQLPNLALLRENLLKQEKALTLMLQQFEKALQHRMQDLYNSAKNVYPMLAQQLQAHGGLEVKQHLETLELLREHELPYDAYNSFMQTLLAELPSENPGLKSKPETSVAQLEESAAAFSHLLQKDFTQQCKKVEEQLIGMRSYFQQLRSRQCVWKSKATYEFSAQLKHPQITIASATVAKSAASDSYRFALLSPALDTLTSFMGEFLIRRKVSEWLAVGMCYQNRVKASNYNFDYVSPNHGAYMLSCNGGGWSEIDRAINGTFWGFKFEQGDRIAVHYSPSEGKIHFKNVRTGQQRTLDYQKSAEDQLHFCVLFYYNNDEIEFVGEFRQ